VALEATRVLVAVYDGQDKDAAVELMDGAMTVEVARPLCRGYNIRAFATALTLFLLLVCVRAWQSLVGVPPVGVGAKPVLSELAGVYGVLLRGAPGANALIHQRAPSVRRETDGDARSSGDGGTGLLLRDFAFSDGDATGGATTAATGMAPSPGGGGAGGGAALAADALANGFTACAFALRSHRQWDQAGAFEVRGASWGRPTLPFWRAGTTLLSSESPPLFVAYDTVKKRREFPHLPCARGALVLSNYMWKLWLAGSQALGEDALAAANPANADVLTLLLALSAVPASASAAAPLGRVSRRRSLALGHPLH
jgi:hypothetical protein